MLRDNNIRSKTHNLMISYNEDRFTLKHRKSVVEGKEVGEKRGSETISCKMVLRHSR